jgi:transcriptional regulator with XRE-family HTH domain
MLRTAVGLRSMTLRHFADTLGVSQTHLNLVLRGKRTSQRIDTAVDDQLVWGFGIPRDRPDLTTFLSLTR